jgi:hypothetical protein
MATAPHSNSSRRVVPPGKSCVLVIHLHVCGKCGNLRLCDDVPCWLGTMLHREWICSKCCTGPAVALPIAA